MISSVVQEVVFIYLMLFFVLLLLPYLASALWRILKWTYARISRRKSA